jgi:hypothetical protein
MFIRLAPPPNDIPRQDLLAEIHRALGVSASKRAGRGGEHLGHELLLRAMGLLEARAMPVGGGLVRGVSGGQRRRVTTVGGLLAVLVRGRFWFAGGGFGSREVLVRGGLPRLASSLWGARSATWAEGFAAFRQQSSPGGFRCVGAPLRAAFCGAGNKASSAACHWLHPLPPRPAPHPPRFAQSPLL